MGKQYLDNERRKLERAEDRCVVFSRITSLPESNRPEAGKEFNAIMLDFSAGGMAFLVNEAISENSSVANKFVLVNARASNRKDYFKPVEIKGKVCYCFKKENGRYRVGLKFTNQQKDSVSRIDKFIKVINNSRRRT